MRHQITFALVLATQSAWTQWNSNPSENTPIAVLAEDQSDPRIIKDETGGAIIAWSDTRATANGRGVFAQRINAQGEPLWALNGVPVVTEPLGQKMLNDLVSDNSGGAILVYQLMDGNGNHDLYAQRLNGAGQVLWNTAGVPVCTETHAQLEPVAVSDGNGGVWVAWWDTRNDEGDVYAQHLDMAGIPQLSTNGIAVCTGSGGQGGVRITSNGAGGAIVGWFGGYFGVEPGGVRLQNVADNGSLLWPVDGVRACTLSSPQFVPEITANGNGGAVVTWVDRRNDGTGDLYAQLVNASGTVQWDTTGVLVDDGIGEQGSVAMARSGTNATFMAWSTPPDTVNLDNNIRAQLLGDDGIAAWEPLGKLVCGAPLYQSFPRVVEDLNGDAVVAWLDARNGADNNLYMQRISAAGSTIWQADGVPLANGGNNDHWWNSINPGNKQLLPMTNGIAAVWNKIPIQGFMGDVYASLMGIDGTAIGTLVSQQQAPAAYRIYMAENQLVIQVSKGTISNVRLVDVLGHLVTTSASVSSTEVRLSLADIPPGVLFAQFLANGIPCTDRFLNGPQ